MRSNISSKCSLVKLSRLRLCRLSQFLILVPLAAAIAVSCIFGCAHVNDPWRDSSVAINQDMRTPSSETYSKGNRAEFPAERRRAWDAHQVTYHNGAVTHWPLWFEDPFEDRGNSDVPMKDPALERSLPDNEFAWNWVDYFHMPYGLARQYLNIIGWPVSAAVTPPGTLLDSDTRIDKGLLCHDHDAKRSDSVGREPPDVAMLTPPYGHPETAPQRDLSATDH